MGEGIRTSEEATLLDLKLYKISEWMAQGIGNDIWNLSLPLTRLNPVKLHSAD